MNNSNTDRIEKQIELRATIARVWQALTDYKEFGEWFRVNLEGPFVPGKTNRGNITYTGYEHLIMEVVVQKMAPERLFSHGSLSRNRDLTQYPQSGAMRRSG